MNFAEQFHSASDKIIRSFQQLGADWMLIGALPVAAWGQPRATTDADFAVSLELQLERQWAVLDWAYLKTWSLALGLDFLLKEVLRPYLQEKGLPPQLPLP